MAKNLFVDPEKMRAPGKMEFCEIPLNQYQKTVSDEINNFTKEELTYIYRDMCYIREFETMLHLIKTTGEYEGVAYNHPGPAHLGIGQEAAYVGEAFSLTPDDYIFGSHRSHGEILAKGLRTTQIMEESQLRKVMEDFFGGRTLEAVDHGEKVCKRAVAGLFALWHDVRNICTKKWIQHGSWRFHARVFYTVRNLSQ